MSQSLPTKLYPTLGDHINHHPYTVMHPASWQPIIPNYIKESILARSYPNQFNLWGTISDPVTPFDNPQELVYGTVTISNMVDILTSRLSFEIINDEDVLEISAIADGYVTAAGQQTHNSDVVAYMKKFIPFRNAIDDQKLRVLNRHPDWKQQYDNMDGLVNALKMFADLMAQVPKVEAAPQVSTPLSHTIGPSFDNRYMIDKLKELGVE